jgi:hypothetical protein
MASRGRRSLQGCENANTTGVDTDD